VGRFMLGHNRASREKFLWAFFRVQVTPAGESFRTKKKEEHKRRMLETRGRLSGTGTGTAKWGNFTQGGTTAKKQQKNGGDRTRAGPKPEDPPAAPARRAAD